jgi:hypothetical protein
VVADLGVIGVIVAGLGITGGIKTGFGPMGMGSGELGTSFCKTIVNNLPGWLPPLGYWSPQVFPVSHIPSCIPLLVKIILIGLQLEEVIWEGQLPLHLP